MMEKHTISKRVQASLLYANLCQHIMWTHKNETCFPLQHGNVLSYHLFQQYLKQRQRYMLKNQFEYFEKRVIYMKSADALHPHPVSFNAMITVYVLKASSEER